MMPLACLGSPQDTLTEVVVNSLKWMKLGALGACFGEEKGRKEVMTVGSLDSTETTLRNCSAHVYIFMKTFVNSQ